nr:hypothetical protein [Tanacetum cinerariifolium]
MGEGSTQPTDTQHTPTFDMPPPKPKKTQKPRQPKRKTTKVPQASGSTDIATDEEDTSKQGRMDEIDGDKDIALVSTHNDNIVQDEGIEDVGEEEVVVTTAKITVDAAQVTTAIVDILVSVAEIIVTTAPTITAESTKTYVEVTQAPRRKEVMIQEPEETTKTASLQQPQKHQIRADEELAVKLQAKIDEDENIAKEKAQRVKDVNLAWDAEKAKLFMEFLEKRRKFFAAKRAKENRNTPPTKAIQRSLMCIYLKNMDGWRPRALKNKSFAEIQELFDKAMKG